MRVSGGGGRLAGSRDAFGSFTLLLPNLIINIDRSRTDCRVKLKLPSSIHFKSLLWARSIITDHHNCHLKRAAPLLLLLPVTFNGARGLQHLATLTARENRVRCGLVVAQFKVQVTQLRHHSHVPVIYGQFLFFIFTSQRDRRNDPSRLDGAATQWHSIYIRLAADTVEYFRCITCGGKPYNRILQISGYLGESVRVQRPPFA